MTTVVAAMLPVIPLWIDGAAVTSVSTDVFTVQSAAKGKDVVQAHSATVESAKLAAESSWTAFGEWKTWSAVRRRDLVNRVANILEQRADEIVESQIEETSCTEAWARMNVNLAIASVREVASRLTSISGEIPSMSNTDQLALVFREPFGPILTIAPWNASIILASRAITAPIGVGCTVVFKASELCPRTHHLLREAWTEAGLPKGVLNVIQTKRENAGPVTEALIAHPAIRKVEFIGSRPVGKLIGEMCARHCKPIFMELGGKSAAIVLDDANLEQAAHLSLMGAWLHHGQICFSTERILVHTKVAAKFTEIIRKKSNEFSAGHAVNLRMAENANSRLVEAQAKGAEFLIGGPGFNVATGGLKPTILTNVTKDMTIFEEEAFGPSASLYVFQDDADAVKIANNSIYGLNAAVHTTSMERGLNLARKLEVGQVHINNLTAFDEATIPVGGEKGSGWGRSNGLWGLSEYLTYKTITFTMKEMATYI